MNHGHPSKPAQVQMQEKLRRYFELGISATLAAQKVGLNVKTACKYYDEWTERITEQQNGDFLERQKADRERTIISFDTQILDMLDSLDSVNIEIKRYQDEKNPVPRYLFAHRLEVQKVIADLIAKRGAFAMQPSIDDNLREKIQELIREHAARSSS